MKKIIMTIGVFAIMSFGHQKYENWKFNEIMNTLADMEEWMNEDIFNGRIDKELGEMYIENINQVILLTLSLDEEDACIRNQELEERIEKYTN